MVLYYFDDPEEGLARETSHPSFVERASADFYYDAMDEFSPFGSDSGNDALTALEGWYRERRAGEKALTFLRNLVQGWGFDVQYLEQATPAQLEALDKEEQYLNDVIDQAAIAVAFGQYKIAGRGDKAMLVVAANAFRRQRYIANLANNMGSPWEHYDEYLARIAVMEADLQTLAIKKAR